MSKNTDELKTSILKMLPENRASKIVLTFAEVSKDIKDKKPFNIFGCDELGIFFYTDVVSIARVESLFYFYHHTERLPVTIDQGELTTLNEYEYVFCKGKKRIETIEELLVILDKSKE